MENLKQNKENTYSQLIDEIELKLLVTCISFMANKKNTEHNKRMQIDF